MPKTLHYVNRLWNSLNWDDIPRLSWKPAVLIAILLFTFLLLAYRIVRRKRLRCMGIEDEPPRPFRRVDRIGFFLFLLLSFLVNYLTLTGESLSTMEGTYLLEACQNQGVVQTFANRDGILNSHPPLYRCILHPFLFLGSSVHSLRAVSCALGALATAFCYLFSIHFLSRPLGSVLTLLFLLSPIHVYLSQSVMPYSLLSCLVFAYYVAFLRFYHHRTRFKAFLYVVVMALGLNLHAIFLGMLLPPFCYALVSFIQAEDRSRERVFFFNYLEKSLLAGFLMLPFLGIQLTYLRFFTDVFPRMMKYLDVVPLLSEMPSRFSSFYMHLFSLMAGVFPANGTVGVLSILFFFVASLYVLVSRGIRAFLFSSGPLYVLLIEQLVAFTYLKQLNFEIRYYCFAPVFFWMPSFLILDGIAGRKLPALPAHGAPTAAVQKRIVAAIASLLLLLPLKFLGDRPSIRLNPDLQSLAQFLRASFQPGDALCVTPAPFFGDVVLYHLGSPWDTLRAWSRTVASLQVNAHTFRDHPLQDMGYITNALLPWGEASENLFFERIWLIHVEERTLGYPEYSDKPFHKVKHFYDRFWRESGRWSFDGVHVYLYRVQPNVPGFVRNSFRLTLGKDDYPYLKGFFPPITQESGARYITQGATVRIPVYGEMVTPAISILLETSSSLPDNLLVDLRDSGAEKPIRFRVSLAGPPRRIEKRLEIEGPLARSDYVEVSFRMASLATDPKDPFPQLMPVRLCSVELFDADQSFPNGSRSEGPRQ